MTLAEAVMEKVKALPVDKQQEVLDFAEFLSDRDRPPRPRRSAMGLWADLGVSLTDEDIEEARRQMWGAFPRGDI